jgi:hypothetical protein
MADRSGRARMKQLFTVLAVAATLATLATGCTGGNDTGRAPGNQAAAARSRGGGASPWLRSGPTAECPPRLTASRWTA